MKPLAAASVMAILLAPVLLDPAIAGAQPLGYYGPGHAYYGPPPLDDGYRFGSPNVHPPAYATPIYGRPSYVPSRFAPRIPPGYDPERPARSGWRRGQHLPPSFRGDIVADYARYHLRRPPRGYCWYRDADDYVLAAVSTGLIFDVIDGD